MQLPWKIRRHHHSCSVFPVLSAEQCWEDLEGRGAGGRAVKGRNLISSLPLWKVWLRGNPAAVLRLNCSRVCFQRGVTIPCAASAPRASTHWTGRGSRVRMGGKTLARFWGDVESTWGSYSSHWWVKQCSELNRRKCSVLAASPWIPHWGRIWEYPSFSFSVIQQKKEAQPKASEKKWSSWEERKKSGKLVIVSRHFPRTGGFYVQKVLSFSFQHYFHTWWLHTFVLDWGSLWSFTEVCSCLKPGRDWGELSASHTELIPSCCTLCSLQVFPMFTFSVLFLVPFLCRNYWICLAALGF